MTVRHPVSQTGEEEALQSRTHDLGERVKELKCLYGMSRLAQRPGISLEQLLQGTVDLIPPSWQYPEVTCARIILDGRECRTENFGETAWRQTSDIIVNGERSGAVEVCYLQEKPEADEGPFLKEERDLINAVAAELGRTNDRKRVEEELREYRDRLEELVGERTAELTRANEELQREVIERRQAEEALRESEERFSKAFHASPLAIVIATVSEARIIDANEGFLQLIGYSREEVIGRTSLELGMWADSRDRERAVQEVLKRGRLPDGEGRVRTRSGEMRELLTAFVAIELDGVLCLLWMSRDITERRQAEEALRESEARYKALFAGAPEGMLVADLETRQFRHANPAMCKMFGYTEEEFLRLGVPDIHPKESLSYVLAEFEAQARGEKLLSADLPCRRKDDSLFYANVNTTVVVLDGRPCNVGFFTDVTERKKAEEALRKSEDVFRTLSASAPVGIFLMMDDKGQVIYTNERLQAIAGVPPGGGPMEELATAVHPDERERVLAEWVKAAEEHAELSQEFRILTAQGETRWVHLHARPIFSADGSRSSVVGTVEDTTERRQAEERDRQLHAEHARANELRRMVRILEQMAATLAHELRNPLGVISNSAYFLANHAGIDDPKVERHAEIIGGEVASAKRVIDDILEFAHVSEILPSPASLNAIVDQALTRSQVPANIRVTRRLALDLPPLVCDEERLERALVNVITNAVQAMPHGGRLSAKTRRTADGVEAVFTDTGEGIASQDLAKIFDPMFTTKLRGIGLGLTVVRRTVEQHGGRVELESTLGRGTTVTVALPLDSQSARSKTSSLLSAGNEPRLRREISGGAGLLPATRALGGFPPSTRDATRAPHPQIVRDFEMMTFGGTKPSDFELPSGTPIRI